MQYLKSIMSEGQTKSEKYIINLCKRSFLKIWTHPNPIGKKGKELCDCLIVCGNHVIIISVKDIEYKDTGDGVGFKRWEKAAIEKSISQVYGAERWLKKSDKVIRKDGRMVQLPPKKKRLYHRLSISLGGRGEVFLKMGDFGSGYVHVFDEKATEVIFQELDTILDFVDFLEAVESLSKLNFKVIFSGGGIEDLLAMYISYGYSFDEILKNYNGGGGMMMIEDNIWSSFSNTEEFQSMKEEREISYIWDRLIGYFSEDYLNDGFFDFLSKDVSDNQQILMGMALQRRTHRWNLGESLEDFLTKKKDKVRSRVVLGDRNTVFVFLYGKTSDREHRSKELYLRCFVIRAKLKNYKKVIGISFDRPGTSEIGYSSEMVYLHIQEMSKEDHEKAVNIQKELEYFKELDLRDKI